jgi:hypothetical protein
MNGIPVRPGIGTPRGVVTVLAESDTNLDLLVPDRLVMIDEVPFNRACVRAGENQKPALEIAESDGIDPVTSEPLWTQGLRVLLYRADASRVISR